MKTLQSVLCALALVIALSSTALAGNIHSDLNGNIHSDLNGNIHSDLNGNIHSDLTANGNIHGIRFYNSILSFLTAMAF